MISIELFVTCLIALSIAWLLICVGVWKFSRDIRDTEWWLSYRNNQRLTLYALRKNKSLEEI